MSTIKQLLKRVLPAELLRHLQNLRFLRGRARVVYVTRLCARTLAPGRPRRPMVSNAGFCVMICRGNIMRSAFAAELLNQRIGATPFGSVVSAGVRAIPGRQADHRAMLVAQEHEVDLETHRARRIDRELVRSADLLVIMDGLNEAQLLAEFPEAAAKVVFLGDFDPHGLPHEIDDPYTGDMETVRRCFARIARCVHALVSSTRVEVLT